MSAAAPRSGGFYRRLGSGELWAWQWWVVQLAERPAEGTELHVLITPKHDQAAPAVHTSGGSGHPWTGMNGAAQDEWWRVLHWIAAAYRLKHYGLVMPAGSNTWHLLVGAPGASASMEILQQHPTKDGGE